MNPFAKLAMAASYTTACPYLRKPENEQDLTGLAKYLPTVGAGIGAILALESQGLFLSNANPLLSGAVLVISWIAITGGIHMDGLMDTADGIFSHRNQARMLDIMKDSRVGNFGALAGLCVVLLKLTALASLPQTITIATLLLVPAWSRWTTIIAIGGHPYLRQEGMGKIWHDSTHMPIDLLIAALVPILITIAVCYGLQDTRLALIPILTVVSGLTGISTIQRILGGQTGDTYGAVSEIAESGGLLLTALLLSTIQ